MNRVKSEMMIGVVARELGLVEQTLRNRVKAAEKVKLTPPGGKVVTPELMETAGTTHRPRASSTATRMSNVLGTRHEVGAEAIADSFDYIEPFYNDRRRHSTLGYASPQFLNAWSSRQHEKELAA